MVERGTVRGTATAACGDRATSLRLAEGVQRTGVALTGIMAFGRTGKVETRVLELVTERMGLDVVEGPSVATECLSAGTLALTFFSFTAGATAALLFEVPPRVLALRDFFTEANTDVFAGMFARLEVTRGLFFCGLGSFTVGTTPSRANCSLV